MKKFFLKLMALVALMLAAPAAHAADDWFDVLSDGGETLAIHPDISTLTMARVSWCGCATRLTCPRAAPSIPVTAAMTRPWPTS